MEKQPAHKLLMNDRSSLAVDGVNHVGSFDEREIILETQMGVMLLRGDNLHITQLNLDDGNLLVEGFITSIEYTEDKGGKNFKARGKGILDKIFK